MTDAPYTVLVPRELGEFADSPSIWRRAVRRERATQLERTLGKPGKYLGKYLRVPFGRLGLKREFKSDGRVVFEREIDIGAQHISIEPTTGAVDVSFALECRPVEAIIDGFGKTLARVRPWTFALSLGYLEKRPSIFYNYQSAEELEALANHVGARIPWWLHEMSTIQGLDRVLQQHRSAAGRSSHVTRRLAELALAHLVGAEFSRQRVQISMPHEMRQGRRSGRQSSLSPVRRGRQARRASRRYRRRESAASNITGVAATPGCIFRQCSCWDISTATHAASSGSSRLSSAARRLAQARIHAVSNAATSIGSSTSMCTRER
jgi:hypothetical protein